VLKLMLRGGWGSMLRKSLRATIARRAEEEGSP